MTSSVPMDEKAHFATIMMGDIDKATYASSLATDCLLCLPNFGVKILTEI